MKALTLLGALLVMNLLCVVARPATFASQEKTQDPTATLSNKDIVDLVRMGISTEIIVAKIRASAGRYDTSPTALQDLKAANVPDAIILAMVQSPAATNMPEERTGTGPTTVYVYRHKNFNSRNMQPSVYVDGVEVARMDDGKFFSIKLDSGKHSVEVNKGHSGAEIDMKPGEQYYFRVEIIPGFWKGRSQMTYMQKEQGSLELKKMKPLESKWVKDKRVSVEEFKNPPQ